MSPRRRDVRAQRTQIAQLAARLLVDGSTQSFGTAKRKAGATMAVTSNEDLPDNLTVLAAVIDYQQLFDRAALAPRNERLRRAALSAMRFLQDFEPRLHGPVLYGTTLRYSVVGLHLFEDEIERVVRYLLSQRVHYHLDERLHGARKQDPERYPTLGLDHNGVEFELTLLPRARLKRPLINSLSAAPYQYLDYSQLATLLTQNPGGYCLEGLNLVRVE